MAEGKKGFLMYADYITVFESLTNEEAGMLFKHILRYVNDLDPELDDRLLKILFEPIKQQMKRDLNKWECKKETRVESGRAGGVKSGEVRRSKMKQNEANEANPSILKQTQANEPVNVNVNANVTVNDTVTVKETKYKAFAPPTKDEVFEYMKEKVPLHEARREADKFFYYYESVGWLVGGKTKMKNWKSSASGWLTRFPTDQHQKDKPPPTPEELAEMERIKNIPIGQLDF
jgi:hypothetical protein